MVRLGTLLLVLVWGLSASAGTVIVDPDGSGDALTIQGGIDLAQSGDVVLVMPGTYGENVVLTTGVRLESESGPASTIIDGHGDTCVQCIACGAGTAIVGFTLTNGGGDIAGGVYVFDHSDVEIAGNVIRNNVTTYEGAGVHVQRFSNAWIHDNQFLDNHSYHSCAIAVIVSSQALIERNLFRRNVSEFLTSAIGINTASVTIDGNWFIENEAVHGATVHVVWPGTFATVTNNSFVFNHGSSDGGSGVYAYLGATMNVSNNIFAFNEGTAAILGANNPVLTLACNVIWENDIDFYGIPNPFGSNGNANVDPLICSPLTDDVELSAYSPCLTGTCGVIGANGTPACTGAVPVEQQTWGQVKESYR